MCYILKNISLLYTRWACVNENAHIFKLEIHVGSMLPVVIDC